MAFLFSPEIFLRDISHTTAAMDSPYSELATRAVLDAYGQNFADGAVLWRATDKPGSVLNYRFYERKVTDSIGTAIRAGLLDPDNRMIRLLSSWRALYGGTPTEHCDFDADSGLSKAWLYLGGLRPVQEILSAPGVPESISKHEPMFRDVGLASVRHVAVDYHQDTANIYFRTSGPLTSPQCEQLISLAQGQLPSDAVFADMQKFTSPRGYTFSVTLRIDDGAIQRVGFYALKLPAGEFPSIEEPLRTFFRAAPSYDEEEMNAIAWSFGSAGKNYVKAERSYCGRLVALMKDWNSPMTAVGNRPSDG